MRGSPLCGGLLLASSAFTVLKRAVRVPVALLSAVSAVVVSAVLVPAVLMPAVLVQASDQKLEMPDLKSPEWKEVKEGQGLKIWDVKEGSGEAVEPGGRVKVHYTGWLTNGTIFDSSVQRNEPIEFSLNQVIEGWRKGVPGMKPGGVRRLYIPYPLAYGERARGDTIPAKSDLVFEIQLLEVK